jgi:O-antigen ligase
MATRSPSIRNGQSIFARLFGLPEGSSFLDTLFFPAWVPILLGAALGLVAASLILGKEWLFLIPVVMVVPASILFLRYPYIAVILWMLAAPFFVKTTSGNSRYMFWLLHRAMIPGALGLILLAGWLGVSRRRRVKLGFPDLMMVIFLVVGAGNIYLLTGDPNGTLVKFYDRIFVPFCMYWLVRLYAPTEKEFERIVWIAPIGILTQTAIGLVSWFRPNMLPAEWLGRAGERTVGSFGNPGVFTTTLLFLALFLFQYATQAKSRLVQAGSFLLVGVAYFSVFFSFSRASWLGGLFIILGLLYLYPKTMVRLSAIAIVIVVIVAAPVLGHYVNYAIERLTTEETTEGRVLGGAATLGVIQSNPLFGVGFGNHDLYDEQFRTRVFDLAVNEAHTSHNTYLLFMAEMGLTGFFFYFVPTAYWFLRSRSTWRRLPPLGFRSWRMLGILWLVILDQITVSNFTDIIQSNLFGTTMWWLTLALIASLVDPAGRSARKPQLAGRARATITPIYPYRKPTMKNPTMNMSDIHLQKQISINIQAPTSPAQKTDHIFIVGVSRSGTSLMRHILNQSDSIAIARENHFLGHLLGSEGMRHKFRQFGDLSNDDNARAMVDFIYSGGLDRISKFRGMSSHFRWIIRRVDKEVFLEKILASDRSERALFAVMIQLFADRKGKPIAGEKTPAHIRYVPTLLDWFSNARVIHMLRDPRAIFVSELRRRYKESDSTPYRQLKPVYPLFKLYILFQTTLAWLESVNRYHQYKKSYPDHYTLVKFEDLVREPEKHIHALCDFIGVEFQSEMLEQSVVSSGFQVGQAGFDASAADRWKKQIDAFSSAWFTFWFRRYLKEFGYI